MRFAPTELPGAFVIDLDRFEDERGFFARTFDGDELAKHGLAPHVCQCSISFNKKKGTLRGMHYQVHPHEETKLVRCVRGAVFDVLVDLRRESPTFRRWIAVELTAENRRALYVPPLVAHGFQTLTDEAELHYMMSTPYVPEAARGVRWDDPAFAVRWPEDVRTIAAKDLAWSDFVA